MTRSSFISNLSTACVYGNYFIQFNVIIVPYYTQPFLCIHSKFASVTIIGSNIQKFIMIDNFIVIG